MAAEALEGDLVVAPQALWLPGGSVVQGDLSELFGRPGVAEVGAEAGPAFQPAQLVEVSGVAALSNKAVVDDPMEDADAIDLVGPASSLASSSAAAASSGIGFVATKKKGKAVFCVCGHRACPRSWYCAVCGQAIPW